MELTLYNNFKKRSNSTLTPPNNTASVVLNGELKEGYTSIYNPSFLVRSFNTEFNYLKWNNRYYYINNIEYFTNELFSIDCELDYLATFKSDILNSYGFILYSSSEYDDMIPDRRLTTDSTPMVSFEHKAIFTTTTLDGFGIAPRFVVTYIGNKEGTNPVIYLTEEQLTNLANIMQNPNFNEIFTDPTNAFYRIVTDSSSAVTSVIYNPISAVEFSMNDPITLCSYNTGITGQKGPDTYTRICEIDIPWNYDDFRNRHEYTSIIMHLPCYGLIELNPDDLIGKEKLYVRATIDNRLGGITYIVSGSTAFREVLYKCSATASSPVQFGTIRASNVLNGLVGVGTAIASTATGNYLNAIGGAFNAVTNLMQRQTGVLGSNGDLSNFYSLNEITLTCISHGTNIEPDEMRQRYGRPLNQIRKIETLSGYCQTNEIHISSINNEVSETLENALNGGIYIE